MNEILETEITGMLGNICDDIINLREFESSQDYTKNLIKALEKVVEEFGNDENKESICEHEWKRIDESFTHQWHGVVAQVEERHSFECQKCWKSVMTLEETEV